MSGAWAVQNRGTLGGNIANASPAADTPPVLLVYDAQIELASSRATRWLPYREFHVGYKATRREPGELITRVRLPNREAHAASTARSEREAHKPSARCAWQGSPAGRTGGSTMCALPSGAWPRPCWRPAARPTTYGADVTTSIDRGQGSHPARRRDRPHRRHPLYRTLSPRGGRQPAGAVSRRDSTFMMSLHAHWRGRATALARVL